MLRQGDQRELGKLETQSLQQAKGKLLAGIKADDRSGKSAGKTIFAGVQVERPVFYGKGGLIGVFALPDRLASMPEPENFRGLIVAGFWFRGK